MKKYFAFLVFLILIGLNRLSAQDYLQVFQEGEKLYQSEDYYEAYLRFKAALALSENVDNRRYVQQSREWMDKAALGIQQQQQRTDSLLQATRKLTDAFYFYDDRLALAYKDGKFGFINKKGEVVIDYQYVTAGNFDEASGYAKVERSWNRRYWLSPEGKEYSVYNNVDSLPKIEKDSNSIGKKSEFDRTILNLRNYKINSIKDYYQEFRDGVRLYNEGKYYEAYLRFNAVDILAENAADKLVAQIGKQLKDDAIDEIRQLYTRAKEALTVANNIRNAFYFYDDKYALAFKNGYFYFIDWNGDEFVQLGRWEKAGQFDRRGWAQTEKAGNHYLIDTSGQMYQAAYYLHNLHEEILALDLKRIYRKLDHFPVEIFSQPQLQVLLLDGRFNQKNRFESIPKPIQKLRKLKVISMSYGDLKILPAEIGQLTNLRELDLQNNQLSELPVEIGRLTNLNSLDLRGNLLSEFPIEISQLTNLKFLNLGDGFFLDLLDVKVSANRLRELPAEIGQLTNLREFDLKNNELSELPAEIGQLFNLSSLVLSENNLSKLPSEIGQLTNLSSLDLRENQLRELPVEIGRLINLSSLDLRENQLRELPVEIGRLTNLSSLNLRENQLRELPVEIGRLTNLSSLDLRENQLSELPVEIGRLTNLSSLDLRKNQLSELPVEIGRLTNLNTINLYNNRLRELPAEVGQLSTLSYLNLSLNRLNELPVEIGQLSNLKELDLEYNQLSLLPSEIGKMTNLKKLDLSSNDLTELPPEISQMTNLSSLNLGYNQLSELPSKIGQMANLRWLNLSSNDLRNLPPEIGQMSSLRVLILNRNDLKELPLEIGQTPNLKSLYLEENDSLNMTSVLETLKQSAKPIQITTSDSSSDLIEAMLSVIIDKLDSIPTQIGQMLNLKAINLSYQLLDKLPYGISNLSNLSSLDLLGNRLSQLPPEISKLSNLNKLDLTLNQLSNLPPEIGQMKNLTDLNLQGNQLINLPSEIGQLANLSSLNLSGNQLSELPSKIGQLINLNKLDLRGNQLTELPAKILSMKSLKEIYLSGNPFSVTYIEQLRIDMPWCDIKWTPPGADDLFADKKYLEAFAAQQKAIAADSTNYSLHFNLSWYALFAQKPETAIIAAKKALALNPGAESVATNLALGYLLDGQWTEAEKIYRRWKGKSFSNDRNKRLCNNVFLQDITDLEAAGITHPDFEKVRKLMKE